jgi:hypothetical protein
MADLITIEQLEARLSATGVTRLYDDDNDGEADDEPIAQLCRDASSKVRGKLGPVYDPDNITADAADEVVRVALDQAFAMAVQRFPEVMKFHDWEKLMAQADKDLKELRNGMANLGVNTPPEPAANQGGRVTSGNPNRPTPRKRFSDNWGDF